MAKGATMAKHLDEETGDDGVALALREEWEAKMQEAWPHLRAAVWERVQGGEPLDDLVGVVAEVPGDPDDEEESLTVGVLTREELAETMAGNEGDAVKQWLRRLQNPAPAGCIYVFGSFCGQ